MATLAMAGCSGTGVAPVGLAGRAVQTTASTRTAGVDFDIAGTYRGNTTRVHFSGSYNFVRKVGSWTTLSMSPNASPPQSTVGPAQPNAAPAAAPAAVETIMATADSYFESLPPLAVEQFGGRHWYYLHYADFPALAGASISKALQITFTDPEAWLALLGATEGKPRFLGNTLVDTVQARLYGLTVNLSTAADASGSLLPMFDKDITLLRVGSLPIQVAIDDAGRLVQAAVAMDISAPGQSTTTSQAASAGTSSTSVPPDFVTIDAVVTFTDFGIPFTPVVPSPQDSVDILSTLVSSSTSTSNPTSVSIPFSPTTTAPLPAG